MDEARKIELKASRTILCLNDIPVFSDRQTLEETYLKYGNSKKIILFNNLRSHWFSKCLSDFNPLRRRQSLNES